MSGESSDESARARLARVVEGLEYHRAVDVDARLDGAAQAERDADHLGDEELKMRARLVRADMLQRGGRTSEGAAIATEVNRWAREHESPPLLARSHLVLSSICEGIGDGPACLDHALRAVELMDESTPPRARANFLTRLGDALAVDGSFDAARQRYREAQAIFAAIGDVERQLNVLNNLAYAEVEAGDAIQARAVAEEMRLLDARSGERLNAAFLDTMARAHIGVGEYAEAEAALREALTMLDQAGSVQAVTPAEILLSLAEVQRRRGNLVAAQETLDRCRAVCVDRDLGGIEVDALAEQAELHAAAGRFDLAYEVHKKYHARLISLTSARRESAARTRQALFETAEARQEALRYWRQARTDALTGLPNRRFLDEELPVRLSEVSARRQLAVAIVDADRFKRINDELSHAIGDRAICELALVLESALRAGREGPGVAGPGDESGRRLVARLGGEEFLILLPTLGAKAAAGTLETVRAAVAGHDWQAVIGRLRLTVSIGATIARPADTSSDVLGRADRNLYAAKAAGRNRVLVDDAAAD
jgi:diguanylate cyclase (GGDEF)-like protein